MRNTFKVEHDREFSMQDARLQLFRERDNLDKFRLSLNGQNIIDWFKLKYQELKQPARPHIKPPETGKSKELKDNLGWFTGIC